MSANSFLRKGFWLLILSMLFGFAVISPKNLSGNPVVVTINTLDIGGLIPYNQSHNLQMRKADVSIKLSTSLDFKVQFDGEYRIYNPSDTAEFSIAAPFSDMSRGLEKSLTIKTNGTTLAYTLYEMTETGLILWQNYFTSDYSRVFALCNVTFEGNSTTVIKYEWVLDVHESPTYTYFTYDVGTGRTWKGYVNEKVEFRVYGVQPYKIVEDPENIIPRVQIQKHFIGKSYSWLWENEEIDENTVGVVYRDSYWKEGKASSAMTFIACLLVVVNIILLIVYFMKKRKKGMK